MNTEGGFACECGAGRELSADRRSCRGARGPGGVAGAPEGS